MHDMRKYIADLQSNGNSKNVNLLSFCQAA